MKPNAQQEQIIENFTGDSPNNKRLILVEAPPGTGKTFTAVATAIEFTYMKLRANPQYNNKVLILTFSKNARAQIEKQLDLLGDDEVKLKKYIEISNFHSFFQKYIWAFSKYLGLNEDLLIPSPKQRKQVLINKLKEVPGYDMEDEVQYNWAESLLEGEFYPLTSKNQIKPNVQKLIPYKQQIKEKIIELNKDGYIGFSDMGYHINRLLDKSPNFLKMMQKKYIFIMLDEYQDVSDLQHDIVVKLIGKDSRALFFADSSQLIYEWRGASPNRLNMLLELFENEIEKRELVESMRFGNRKDIMSLISKVRMGSLSKSGITNSENIKYKTMNVKEKNLYSIQARNSMYANLKFSIINTLPKPKDMKGKSIGILCRTNGQVEYLNRALREEFKIYTKQINNNEVEHNVIGDIINFLNRSNANISIDEMCQDTFRFIFEMIYENKIGTINKKDVGTLRYTELRSKRVPFIKDLILLIDEAHRSEDIWSLLKNCMKTIDHSELSVNYDTFGLMKKIFSNNKSIPNIMEAFLQHQYLRAFKDLNGIYILNVHQSKGREFDIVYVVDYESLCSEKNLLYVALSRVKDQLVVLDWVEKK